LNIWGSSFNTAARLTNSANSSSRDEETGKKIIESEELRERKLELKIRKAEDKRLEYLREKILEVENSDLDYDTKKIKIASLTDQIKQIEELRAQREQDAFMRKMEKFEAEAEKRLREAEKNRPEEESDDDSVTLSKDDIKGMVKLSVSLESLNKFKATKASMAAEATQLKQDINNSFGITKYGAVPDGHSKPDDFRNTQLKKLTKGIAGLDHTIASTIRKMNREVNEQAAENARRAAASEDNIRDVPEEDEEEQPNEMS